MCFRYIEIYRSGTLKMYLDFVCLQDVRNT